MTRWIVIAFASIGVAACSSGEGDEPEKSRGSREPGGRLKEDFAWVREMAPGGAFAYSADKRVYLVELNGEITSFGEGFMPEFSPDGSKLAWVRGGPLRVADRKTKEVRILHDRVYKHTNVHWLDDNSVAAVVEDGKGRRWYRFELNGRRERMPELDRLGLPEDKLARETDVRQAADGVWTFVAYQSWKTSDGKGGPIGGGCACSISPDGLNITALQGGHTSLILRGIREGGMDEHELVWRYDGSFDNHRWSSNDERFLIGVEEKEKRMFLVDWRTGRASAFGKKGHKDNTRMYGDFTKEDGSHGVPFPPMLPPDQREGVAAAADEGRGEPVVLEDWPLRTEGMVYLFENSTRPNEFREFERDAPRAYPGTLRDGAIVNRFYGLDLTGGHYEVASSAAEEFLKRVKESGKYSVEFTSLSDAPAGGAVIDFGDNFSFGTPQMSDGYLHVIYSFSSVEPVAYVNGVRVPVAVGTRLPETWRPAALTFGKGWDGQLEGVALYARPIDASEARKRFEAFRSRLQDRQPAPQVVVEAELATYTPPLPLEAMDTYRRCLSEHVFKVKKVVSGELDSELARVLAWSTLDMKILPEDLKGKEGTTFRLTLEPEEAHKQLSKERINASDELDPPGFLLISREEV